MNISMTFLRTAFVLLSALIGCSIGISTAQPDTLLAHLFIGSLGGFAFACLLLILEQIAKRGASLRGLNILSLGIFFGILLGTAIHSLISSILQSSTLMLSPEASSIVNAIIYLSCTYFGTVLIARASQEIYITVPFMRFKPTAPTKKDILLDGSVLHDPRLIDLAASGLMDNHIILPRYIVMDLQDASEEAEDEGCRIKARRSLEVIAKLEALPDLHLRYTDVTFPEIKDPVACLTRLARHLDANILTADISRVQQAAIEGVRVINIHSLSNALKPLTQNGEYMTIKIQRYGKEPRQGVGYLDDGTMVVVNGGAGFIGDTIRTQVLSVKHTSSGRMIFCNALEEGMTHDDILLPQEALRVDGEPIKRLYS